ncbi:MAG: helix-turn-helix domain-containing protein [Actinobacteria bacterium]|nr:helix-turn-helix domain-containing protein [Actinomycetota bacterium]
MGIDNLRDGRVKNWFYLENDLLDRDDLTIYEKTVYIVIARYVNGENKAFPSYETIAKKGSMAKVQAMRVVKSLTQKGLLKKENRKNKDNKGSTSNLYTLLNPKSKNKDNNDKKEGVSVRYPGGNPQISGVVSGRYPNNTNIKNTSLNNVNRAGREVVENPSEELKEITTEDKENINDIKRKIKQSFKEGENNSLVESIKSVVNKYPESKRYKLKENELLAKEIAEVLEDDHSLGAFRAVVDKIPEQKIRIFLSIIKDTYLTGRIKKSRGAMFITLAKDYARKNNVSLNFK